jgi:hypothetical protein
VRLILDALLPFDASRSQIFLRSEIIFSGLQPSMSSEDVG